jgi:hypothetical protein
MQVPTTNLKKSFPGLNLSTQSFHGFSYNKLQLQNNVFPKTTTSWSKDTASVKAGKETS